MTSPPARPRIPASGPSTFRVAEPRCPRPIFPRVSRPSATSCSRSSTRFGSRGHRELWRPRPTLLQVVLELAAAGRMAQLAQRLGLDLADPLAGYVELLADL